MLCYDRLPFDERLAYYRPIIEEACRFYDIPAAWLLAIAQQESRLRAAVITMSGGDGARGGSYGLCQMSLATARGLGYEGSPSELLLPRVNAHLAAHLVGKDRKRFGPKLSDVSAAYNSGKPMSRAPATTREIYVPAVLAFALKFGWTDP